MTCIQVVPVPVQKRVCSFRIQANCLVVVLNGAIVVAFGEVSCATAIERTRRFCIQANCLVVVLLRRELRLAERAREEIWRGFLRNSSTADNADSRGLSQILPKKSARCRVIRGCTFLLRYFHFLLLPDRREANRLCQQDGLDATQCCEHLVVDLAVHLNDRNG